MSAIIQDHAIVHYEVLGHGKPVIFLHSWIGSWRYWISSMQFASTQFRAYAVDFWGFGASKKQSARYSFEGQVELLDGFVGQMGIHRFTLVGHGLGSIIATYYAAEHPNSVERLMVVSFPMGVQNTNSRLQSLSPEESADWLLGGYPPNAESLEDAKKTDHQAIVMPLDQYRGVNWRQLINSVPVTSIWVHGDNDPAISNPSEDQLNYLPEMARFLNFSDSGHYPMIDEPGKFNRLLTDFIHLAPGDDPRQLEIKPIWKRRVR
jgi:pimeloyl-ACP methyl ester carboxylesterase